MSDDRLSAEQRIVTSLFAFARAVGAEIRRAGAAVQLTVPQFSTLRQLDDGDRSVGDLARILHVAMPTVTQSVDSLAGKSLVERYSDERDRRQVRLRITPKGRVLLQQCRRDVEAYVADILSSWPVERRQDLAGTLEEITGLVVGTRLAKEN